MGERVRGRRPATCQEKAQRKEPQNQRGKQAGRSGCTGQRTIVRDAGGDRPAYLPKLSSDHLRSDANGLYWLLSGETLQAGADTHQHSASAAESALDKGGLPAVLARQATAHHRALHFCALQMHMFQHGLRILQIHLCLPKVWPQHSACDSMFLFSECIIHESRCLSTGNLRIINIYIKFS
jgi:hypothetical protein